MDINTQNSSGMMNGMPPTPNMNGPKPEKKIGPIVGTLIIVLVLIVAALYFFGQKLNTQAPAQGDTTTVPSSVTTSVQDTNTASATQANDVQSMKTDLDNQLKNVDYSF